MAEPRKRRLIGVRHIGMFAENPSALAAFYQDVMGMQLVGSSDESSPAGRSAYLSSHPDEESHEIAIFDKHEFAHTAFKVGSLTDLRAFYQEIVDRGLTIRFQLNHGVSLSFYFDDPEGNIVEVYWSTGLAYDQPYAHDIDLSLPEESLMHDVGKLASQAGAVWPASE